jgi:2'-5' RNA ligase
MAGQLIRSFVAIKVPESVLSAVEKYIQNLKKSAPDIHWVKVSGIHITLKFLGEIQPDLVQQVQEILQPLSHLYHPFTIRVKGTGSFPNKSKPRVFWLGLVEDADKTLTDIHEWIDTNLKPLGFATEERGFSPHLTLGRVKRPQNFGELFAYMEKKPSGAEYSELKSYPLQKQEG